MRRGKEKGNEREEVENPPEEIKERKILCLISLTPDTLRAPIPKSCLNYLLFLGGPFCLCLNIIKTVFLS